MSTLQMSASFKGINSSLKPSATRIINRDLSCANLLISQFVQLSHAADFTPSFSGEGNGRDAVQKIMEICVSGYLNPGKLNKQVQVYAVLLYFFIV